MGFLNKNKIEHILKKYNFSHNEFTVFIETGTHLGKTCLELQSNFKKLYTIEISKKYFEISKKSLSNFSNIFPFLGSSSEILPIILNDLNENIFFWLDGHWSGGDTGKGDVDCPLLEECKIIDEYVTKKNKKAIIIIDDCRLFGTNNPHDWSKITTENINSKFDNKIFDSILDLDQDHYQIIII
jgi:hypothetical protein